MRALQSTVSTPPNRFCLSGSSLRRGSLNKYRAGQSCVVQTTTRVFKVALRKNSISVDRNPFPRKAQCRVETAAWTRIARSSLPRWAVKIERSAAASDRHSYGMECRIFMLQPFTGK